MLRLCSGKKVPKLSLENRIEDTKLSPKFVEQTTKTGRKLAKLVGIFCSYTTGNLTQKYHRLAKVWGRWLLREKNSKTMFRRRRRLQLKENGIFYFFEKTNPNLGFFHLLIEVAIRVNLEGLEIL